MYDESLFDKKDLVNLCVSVLKIMRKNDLGIIKRIFKMLFKENNGNEFEITEENRKLVDIFIQAFLDILMPVNCTKDDIKLPFDVLSTLHKNSEVLFKEVANKTFY